MSKQNREPLPPALVNFAWEVVHSEDETHLDFGEGSDVVSQVWFGWTGTEFDVLVQTWYHVGNVPASRLYPSEPQWRYNSATITGVKITEVADTLKRDHNLNLIEAVE